MTEPLAWINDRLVPFSEAAVPVWDLGVVAGASVTEMLRTFGGRPFRLVEHLDRLEQSLDLVGFATRPDRARLIEKVEQLIAHNFALLPAGHDLGVVLFVTAGRNLTYLGAAARSQAGQGTVAVHTFPLPFELWAERYRSGQHLATVTVPPLPADAISPQAKHRNPLHWLRADQEARARFEDAVAVLRTVEGWLTETSAANVLVVRGRTIHTPRADLALGGISQQFTRELAVSLGFEWHEAELHQGDLFSADEVLTTSTTSCLLPVCRFNGRPVGTGQPGPVFRALLVEWSRHVGVDIEGQARLSLLPLPGTPGRGLR